jgi:hypothetical protein
MNQRRTWPSLAVLSVNRGDRHPRATARTIRHIGGSCIQTALLYIVYRRDNGEHRTALLTLTSFQLGSEAVAAKQCLELELPDPLSVLCKRILVHI